MGLKNHYLSLHDSALSIVRKEGFSIDAELNNPNDRRRGLTLLLRPNPEIVEALNEFISEGRALLPGQYFYPPSDLHLTIMPIISCYEGFSLEKLDLSVYDQLIVNSLKGIRKMEIEFEGVFVSPSCLMVKGFPLNEYLMHFRQNLRKSFATSNVEQSLDKRYKLVAAHSTLIRFVKPIEDKEKVYSLLEAYKNFNFGTQYFDQVFFVYNDWYQRKSIVKTLYTYPLL
jgi:2'-5' RNA ligase